RLPRAVELDQPLPFDQVNGLPGLTPQADEQVRGHVRVAGEPGQGAVELPVVRAVVLHGAALLVHDRHHAVYVRIPIEQAAGADALANVLARTRRAVHRADDGDVVARAVAQVVRPLGAAVVALEGARLGGRRRRRAVAAEGVVAVEGVGPDVVDVDVSAGGDVLAGEADDLAVLAHGLAGRDRPHGQLVPQTDPA